MTGIETGDTTAQDTVPSIANLARVSAGLLLFLSILPVAALGPRWELAKFAIFGEIAITPAFMFLAGLLLDGAVRWRRIATLIALAGSACVLACLAAFATRRGWQTGFGDAAPALRLILLPILYALALRILRNAPAGLLVFIALLAHVVGAIFGGKAAFVLTPAPFFVVGALFARNGERFFALLSREKEYAAAFGPVAFALALLVSTQARGATSIAGVGPVALMVGFIAGPAAIAAARALMTTRGWRLVAAIGAAAPALAIGWLPLFYFAVAVARRAAGSPASLLLLSAAAFLVVLIAADAFGEAESRPGRRAAAGGATG